MASRLAWLLFSVEPEAPSGSSGRVYNGPALVINPMQNGCMGAPSMMGSMEEAAGRGKAPHVAWGRR